MHLRRDVRTLYDQYEPRQDPGHLSVQFSLHQNLGAATSQEASPLAERAKVQSQFYCNHSCMPKIPTLRRGLNRIHYMADKKSINS